jgi:ribonucleotide reductase beta subunit family protein with ferritin-like domain
MKTLFENHEIFFKKKVAQLFVESLFFYSFVGKNNLV